MVKPLFIGFVLTLPMIGIVAWLMPLSIWMMIFFVVIWMLWTYIFQGWKREFLINQRDEEMYYWLQNFITTLSIKKTITETFVDLSHRYQLQSASWLKTYTSNDVMQTMINLNQRFKHPIYEIFTSTLSFFEQQGGEVMTLFESIMLQGRLMETRRIEVQRYGKRYLLQWIFLWVLNVVILVISKFSLADLFLIMKETILFQTLILVILGLLPISQLLWFFQWVKSKNKLR